MAFEKIHMKISPPGPGYIATSTTSLTIGTGSKSFTTQAGLAYSVGARARASNQSDSTKWMEGLVTSYSGAILVINVDTVNSSGTLSAWNINVAGNPGASTTVTVGTTTTGAAGSSASVTNSGSTFAATLNFTIPQGIQGIPGSAVNPRGAYAAGTTYTQFDGVTDVGIAYISLVGSNTGHTPASSPTQWQPVDVTAAIWLNVKNYGAVGNGSTDDTTAIQAAITAAHTAGGGTVYVPQGTYKLTSTITLYSSISIIGVGCFETVFQRTGNYGDTFNATLMHNLNFSGFGVKQIINYVPGTPGTASNLPTTGAHFALLGCNHVRFDDMRFQDGFYNVSITGGADITCNYCGFAGTYDSRTSAPKATLYSYVIQPYNATYGVPTFMRLYGCDFMGSNNGTANTSVNYAGINAQIGVYIFCVEDFEMVGGFMGGANSVNFALSATSSTTALLNIRLVGVRFDSAAVSDVFFTADGTATAQAITLTGCVFNGEVVGKSAVTIGNPATGQPAVSGFVLSNNVMYAYTDSAINIQDGKGVNVSGNTIYFYNSNGNVATSLASGVFIGGRCTGFKVADNLIGGGQLFGDYDNSGNKCLFGVSVAALGTTNVGVINGNSTPTPSSIGTLSDLVFLNSARSSTFANLPPTPPTGAYATVTDSNTVTWGATVAGGSSNKVLAFYNGTVWTVAGK